MDFGELEERKDAYWQGANSGPKINYHLPSNYVVQNRALPMEFLLSNTGDESRMWLWKLGISLLIFT